MENKTIIDYALYDGRYLTNPDRAICYTFCSTLKEARRERRDYGDDTVIVECTNEIRQGNSTLIISKKIVS